MKLGIVGGGPAGYLGALKAAILGIDVTLFEKDKIGGVCVNEGCIPVKSLIKIVSNIENIKRLKEKGVNFEGFKFDFKEILKTPYLSTKRLQSGIMLLLRKRNVKIVNSMAKIISDNKIISNNEEYTFDKILIATGSMPKKPPFKVDNFWTSREALFSQELPQRICIVGGGVIGLEFAYIYRTLGSEVEVFEIMEEVLPNEDREFSAILRKELEKMGIRFHLKTKVFEINEKNGKKEIVFEEGGLKNLEFDKVMISVGRELSKDGIPDFIQIERGFIKVDDALRTNIKNIFAAGDCIGGNMLAHTAYYESEIAIENIIGEKKSFDESVVPRVVYTKPEFASCGETEEGLKLKGISYKKEIFKFGGNGRAVAEDKTAGGIKILFDEKGYILGASMVGENVSELITIISVFMKNRIKPADSIDLIFPHPTYSEGIKEVLLKSIGIPLHSID
uniref:Dihydrolipoyl dehydrogenase n=1 Tax=candidate division WOR-3 bacterium TaxID=2052148 RepID=A0A7C4UC32_UNCW3